MPKERKEEDEDNGDAVNDNKSTATTTTPPPPPTNLSPEQKAQRERKMVRLFVLYFVSIFFSPGFIYLFRYSSIYDI